MVYVFTSPSQKSQVKYSPAVAKYMNANLEQHLVSSSASTNDWKSMPSNKVHTFYLIGCKNYCLGFNNTLTIVIYVPQYQSVDPLKGPYTEPF